MMNNPPLIGEKARSTEDLAVKAWERQADEELLDPAWDHIDTLDEFMSLLRKNKAVKGAVFTRAGFVYIAVYNNGSSKSSIATYHCRLAKRLGLDEVKGVKVVDAADARLYKDGSAFGTELGISICNFINP